MFTIAVKNSGSGVSLYEGDDYFQCLNLFKALCYFPANVMEVEMYNTETTETIWNWLSPEWNDKIGNYTLDGNGLGHFLDGRSS